MSKLFYFSPTDENFPHTIQEIGRESLSVIREKTDEELYSQDTAPLPPDLIPVTFHSEYPPGDNVFPSPYDLDIDIRNTYEIWRTDTNEKVPGDLISWSVENNSNEMIPTSTPGIFKATEEGWGNFVYTFTGDESEYSIDKKSIKDLFVVGEPQTKLKAATNIPGHMEIGATHTIDLETTPSDLDLSYVKVTSEDPEVIKVSGLTLTAVGEGACGVHIRFLGDGVYGPSRSIGKYIEVY